MKYGRLLGSYLNIAVYEHLAENSEWKSETFKDKLLDCLSDALEEDIKCMALEDLGAEPDEFVTHLLDNALSDVDVYIIAKALLEDWLDEVIVPKIKEGRLL